MKVQWISVSPILACLILFSPPWRFVVPPQVFVSNNTYVLWFSLAYILYLGYIQAKDSNIPSKFVINTVIKPKYKFLDNIILKKVQHFKSEFKEEVITCRSAECRRILSKVGMWWLELYLGQRVGVAYDECAVGLEQITISCWALWRCHRSNKGVWMWGVCRISDITCTSAKCNYSCLH